MITEDGRYEIDIIYTGEGQHGVNIYYSDGWPDGSGKLCLSGNDLRKILKQIDEKDKSLKTSL